MPLNTKVLYTFYVQYLLFYVYMFINLICFLFSLVPMCISVSYYTQSIVNRYLPTAYCESQIVYGKMHVLTVKHFPFKIPKSLLIHLRYYTIENINIVSKCVMSYAFRKKYNIIIWAPVGSNKH